MSCSTRSGDTILNNTDEEDRRSPVQKDIMIQLKKILFPTDFSRNANSALPYACSLAEQYCAELHVLNVVSSLDFLIPAPDFLVASSETWEAMRQAAQQGLETAVEPSWTEKLKIARAVRRGSEFLEIIRYAQENQIDMIVMGTHGRTGLTHLIIGSVAENVIRKAACPVLTVHPADHSFVAP